MKQIFGFYRIIACYGFMEEPQLNNALTLASNQGLNLDMETTSFYLGREKLVAGKNPKIARWRTNIFFSCLATLPMLDRFSVFQRIK